MAADEKEGGLGKIVLITVLLIIGVFVLVALFLPKDTTTFFLTTNQKIDDFFSSPTFMAIRTISGILTVGLSCLITWLFFRLLEMEKEHEDHVYHHTDVHHDTKHHKEASLKHGHHPEKKTTHAEEVVPHESIHNAVSNQETPRMRTAPPPNRLPGESGVRGTHVGEERPGHTQWQSVLRLATSNNPSDWKLAIIEADVILDMMTYMQGLSGETLGERLKNADPGTFQSLDYAKKAHYTRNRIAHEGDIEFTPREVQQVIRMYEAVFREFKYI